MRNRLMNHGFRMICLAGIVLAFGALYLTIAHLRGDLLGHSIPRAKATADRQTLQGIDSRLAQAEELNPMSLEIPMRRARILAMLGEHEAALTQIDHAGRFHRGLAAMKLEATLLEKVGRPAEAITLLESLVKLSPLDRQIVYPLLRLYWETDARDKLGALALEADMRWYNTFDAQAALGFAEMEENPELALKYFLLADHAPMTEFARPPYSAFSRGEVRRAIAGLREVQSFRDPWAATQNGEAK